MKMEASIVCGNFKGEEKNIDLPPNRAGKKHIITTEKQIEESMEIVTNMHYCRQEREDIITRYGKDGRGILTEEAKQKMNTSKEKQQDEGR